VAEGKHGKELDVQEGNETQAGEGYTCVREGEEHA